LVSKLHRGNVKKLLTLTTVATAMAVLALITACQTVATNDAELAASKKEFLLAQSGFKVITVTTPKQQQAINGLAQYRVSAVKYNGKLYYVFPTATKDKIYVGRQKQYNAYKGALQARLANHPAAQQAQPRSTADESTPYDDIRDCGAPAHRGRAVRWLWSDGHGVFRRLVAN